MLLITCPPPTFSPSPAVVCLCAAPQIPKVYTHYAATALFFFFGFKTLYDAWTHTDDVRDAGGTEEGGGGRKCAAAN